MVVPRSCCCPLIYLPLHARPTRFILNALLRMVCVPRHYRTPHTLLIVPRATAIHAVCVVAHTRLPHTHCRTHCARGAFAFTFFTFALRLLFYCTAHYLHTAVLLCYTTVADRFRIFTRAVYAHAHVHTAARSAVAYHCHTTLLYCCHVARRTLRA